MKIRKINNVNDLALELGTSNTSEDYLSHLLYKHTDCGASLRFVPGGIVVGSIVEGVDGDGTEYYTLKYPFNVKKFWNTIQAIEDEATSIWNETHGCEQCEADGFDGAINPDCPECHGEGVVI